MERYNIITLPEVVLAYKLGEVQQVVIDMTHQVPIILLMVKTEILTGGSLGILMVAVVAVLS